MSNLGKLVSRNKYSSAIKAVESHPTKTTPVTSADVAFADENMRMYLTKQRGAVAQINKLANYRKRENEGDIRRDVASIVVPFYFARIGFTPQKVGMSDYAKVQAVARKYFLDKVAPDFKEVLQNPRAGKFVPSFRSQLKAWWIKNKSSEMEKLMEMIKGNSANITNDLKTYNKDKDEFKKYEEDFKRLLPDKIKRSSSSKDIGFITPKTRFTEEALDEMDLNEDFVNTYLENMGNPKLKFTAKNVKGSK